MINLNERRCKDELQAVSSLAGFGEKARLDFSHSCRLCKVCE